MDLQLEGKRVLVTGSSTGIGECIAQVLAREGALVAVHGRERERTNGVAEGIVANGGKAFAVTGDLATDEGAQQVADLAVAALSDVDILVNNAGIYGNSGWIDTTAKDWAHIYNVNVISMVRLIRHLVPRMKQLGWGRIIQIASGEAMQPFPQMPDYAATKAANVNMTVSLAKELAHTGITVNTISPGIIVNDNIKKFFLDVAKQRGWGTDWVDIEKYVLSEWVGTLTGHLGKVEDVANLVAFVVSPLADYINAANFRVDGGSFL
ncbi:short-chain dehydrogenase [Chroococcidiopsis sp. CCALA 051]|uniref:SDR family NAD(P)-dependent oxidoreductase n=1 Tax=Chroococcidiopsis sp. CCALA 051 TaxID=869949 RepID=UPI000D0CF697|nr:SDR family NAD(P)-dependent oxidoreductase [Chroococcidiopsis sp. CCALA 051]MBE9018611.1 SDR family NAD(P)-dependent oxidoreductase [Chroococcidiopsidales cyanobacterium LEGE 13417]PSM48432.1 short-chain dehydrogenase [Chroococcidiopsis sp. CCALA 051]